MSAFYEEMVELAIEMIEEFGRPMNLITSAKPGTGYDPRPQAQPPVPFTGVQLEFETKEIDGQLVQVGDRLIMMDSTVTPTMGARIRDDDESSVSASIVRILAERPGPATVYYAVQVRG